MGFLQNIKNKLGIGGVKVELQVPAQVSKTGETIDGVVKITSKSEQEVTEIKVKLIEEYTTGRGDDKKEKEYELGSVSVTAGFKIMPGETKAFPFTLPFDLIKSNADELKEKGGALGALGKAAAFANNEKSEYHVEAEASVKGVMLSPSDEKEITLN
ncbi:MAG: sporulation protein [Flavobacteriales bacterium]|nr:sporulation protein [Flavobacteriales bacterium]